MPGRTLAEGRARIEGGVRQREYGPRALQHAQLIGLDHGDATVAAGVQQLHESHAISSRCGRAMKPRMVLPFRISVELRS